MKLYLSIVLILILASLCRADTYWGDSNLPALEIYVIEPVVIENINIWVPAVKSMPIINRSCRAQNDLSFSSALPASVCHQKSDDCPDQVARLLAELSGIYHSQSLPITVFNGWQWEYTYSMCQYESTYYNLPQRGGCWEICWEAVLNMTCGAICLQPLMVMSTEIFESCSSTPPESIITIKTFSSMRIRNGYPKERQL